MVRPRHTALAGRRAQQLRRELTASEARLWGAIKRGTLGARFRRQVAIGIYVVDFASFDPKLVIEVDDTSHEWRDERERTAYVESRGFRILRVTNREVALNLEWVLATIREWIGLLRDGIDPEYLP